MIIRHALSSSPEVREEIHFDTLWRQAQAALEAYSGQIWTDTAEHDPGVTLLQALTYGVSDLAYRHTLPLQDLLTPAVQEQDADGLFPSRFGPQQALTVSPITEDDYRRALLDLVDADGNFLFRNAQLSREQEQDRYTYYFSPATREFLFNQTDDAQQLTVQGYYHLQVELNRGMIRAAAEPILLEFLQSHRNIGEGVRAIDWLLESDVNIQCVLNLEDDFQDFAGLMAQIYQSVEAFISPQAERYSAAQLQDAGYSNEFFYQGPMLSNGWITTLPAVLDAKKERTISVLPLATTLQALAGVQSMQTLQFSNGRWDMDIAAGYCPRAWGAQPLQMLAAGTEVVLMKRGQQVCLRAAEIAAALLPVVQIRESVPRLPYGRHRQPLHYYPASDRIPPCYDLQQLAPEPLAASLHQFLLPFEQQLASACDQLSMVPSLLSFQRNAGHSSQVWGQQWPFAGDGAAQTVHAVYRPALMEKTALQSRSVGQELVLLNHLLAYFGHQRADRTLMNAPDYLASQRYYLSQSSALYYAAGQFQVQRISGIQRRIAARLGFASTLFADQIDMSRLPFYLVEHASLLPRRPSAAYDGNWQAVNAVTKKDDGHLDLISGVAVNMVYPGQLLELQLTLSGQQEILIPACVVVAVSEEDARITLEMNAQLRGSMLELTAATSVLNWRDSNMWLQEINFPLTYVMASPVSSTLIPGAGQQLITVPNFPAELVAGAKISIYRHLSATPFTVDPDRLANHIEANVIRVDRLQRLALIEADNTIPTLPPGGTEGAFRWRLVEQNGHLVADRYSFIVSAVFRDDLLSTVLEPYTTEAWIREIVQQELPCHVKGEIRWMDTQYFAEFSANYAQWIATEARMGIHAFNLIEMLALGLLPSGLVGINAMRIATDAQRTEVVGQNGQGWNTAPIEENNLFYVPSEL
jgi:hypothetical protein